MKTGSEVSMAAHAAVLSRRYPWPSEEAKALVVNFATRACAVQRTRALVMIGSIVRPIATVNDVDLLYVYDEEPLSIRGHPLDVDIRAFSVSEVLKRFQEQQDLIIWSLEFGDLLFERDAFWSELRRRFKERPVLPSPQTALDRAKRAERRLTELEGQGDTDAESEQLLSTLTHRSWFQLLSAGVLPASRAELSGQLRDIGQHKLAAAIERAIQARCSGEESRS